MRQRVFAVLTLVSLLLIASPALAVWQVDFETKSVSQGETGVTVNLKVYWDLDLNALTVPVIVRSTAGGAFWTLPLPVDTSGAPMVGVAWNWSNPGWATLVEDVRPGKLGCNPEGDTGYDGTSPDHFVVNAALAFGGGTPAEPAGRNVVIFTIDVNSSVGTFEFDTACYTSSLNRIFLIDNEFYIDHGPGAAFNKGVITIAPPPVAGFSGTPTSGCAPLTVDFTDESTGSIDTWLWDFGDQETSQDQNPTHQYASAGIYTVKLTVTGPGGSDDEEKTDYITVTVNQDPQLTCPGPISVQCMDDVPAAATDSAGFVAQGGSVSDDCGPVTLTHVGDVSDGNTSPETITRTYRATDAAQNSAECTQIITVGDTQDPQINCPPAVSVECSEDIPAPAANLAEFVALGGSATDNSGTVTVTHISDVSNGLTCPETITRTYQATDPCGNSADCTQTITVNDIQNPQITCPDPISVQCASEIPAPAADSTEFVNMGGTVSDNCGTVTVIHVGDGPPPVGAPNGGGIARTYRATDACGNFAECTQSITIDDVENPQITCPGPISVQCADDVPPPAADSTEFVALGGTVSDNCGVLTVTHVSDVSDGKECPETITRTYRAADPAGNYVECTQMITVDDTQDPQITCPGPVTVQCEADVPAAATNLAEFIAQGGSASDNCGMVTVTHVSDVSDGQTCPETITRTYRATDACGNESTCTQTITVVDNTAPILSGCPEEQITVECDAIPDPANVTASDNCDQTVEVVFDENLDLSGCGGYTGTITRTWTVTDDCGNQSVCTQTITVVDTEAPLITCPADITIVFGESTDPENTGYPSGVTDNCDPDPSIDHSDEEGGETIVRTWKATDVCDNSAQCQQTITINYPPVIECPGDTTAIVGEELTFDVTATDPNIGDIVQIRAENLPGDAFFDPITFTFSWIPTCADVGVYTVRFIASDGELEDTCYVQITVVHFKPDQTSLTFDYQIGQPPPDAVLVEVTSTGCDEVDIDASVTPPEAEEWLTVEPPPFGRTPISFTISIDVTDLSSGTYDGYVVFAEAPGALTTLNGPIQILLPVTLNVSQEYDSCWVAQDVSDTLGAKIAVPITFENGRELAAVGIPLTWDTEIASAWNPNAVFLDSVSFVDSRVGYLTTKSGNIDNDANTVFLGVVVLQGEDFIPPGNGLFATLHFEIVECSDDTIVIDTAFIAPNGYYEFVDPQAQEVPTGFVPGSIIVEPGELRVFLTPEQFYFQATVGGEDPDCQTLILETDFCGVGGWRVRENSDWLWLPRESGLLPDAIDVCVDITDLPKGTYEYTFKVQLSLPDTKLSSGDGIPTWEVPVTLDMSPTGILEEQAGVPDRYFLAQNYPNPFNPSTTIAFGLETDGHTTITVYNLLGQTVAVLVDEYLPAGSHVAVWDRKGQSGQTLPSGIYFYRIRSGDFEQTRKMVLLK